MAGKWSCLEPVDQHGFVIDGEVFFWVLGRACQAAGDSTAGTHYHEEEWQ